MNGIDAIQPNNIFRVNAVNFFENSRQNKNVQNNFESGLFAYQDNNQYNLNHPRVIGSETQARYLDLLA